MWRPNVAASESLDKGAEAWCTEIKHNTLKAVCICIYVVCALFNDVSHSSHCVASSRRVISEYLIEKALKQSGYSLHLDATHDFPYKTLKTIKNFSQAS
jgi:hypothetical protein